MTQAPHIPFPPALVSLGVLGDRGLRIVLEAATGDAAQPWRRHELVWEVVVGFLVRGDPFPKGGPSHETVRDLGTDTPFLAMIRADSHAEPDYVAAMHGAPTPPSSLRHWQVCTTEALIDVAAPLPPTPTATARSRTAG